jgi:hydrogenase maturation factor
MSKLTLGKLPVDLLGRVLGSQVHHDARVVIGPAVGEDAAAIDFGSSLLVAKSDPITFTSENAAWYAVHVNANDVACMGAEPRWFLATFLLPDGYTEDKVEALFKELRSTLNEVGAELVGGHTEVTHGIDRPIICGTMLGETTRDRLVDNRRVQLHDDLVLIKGIAIEATSIIAREKRGELLERFSDTWISNAREFLQRPGISVLEPARRVMEVCRPHAMHDPTEGGIAGAIRELATRANLGVRVIADNIHIYPETEILCAEYGLDPLGLLASGALLVVCAPEETDVLLETIRSYETEAFVIGRFVPEEEGIKLEEDGQLIDLPYYTADEITRIF